MKVIIVDGLTPLQEYLLQSKNIRIKYVTCGKKNCICRLGKRHGPYYYIRKKTPTGYKDIYIKPPKKPLNLKYEVVGKSSIIVDVKDLKEIPDFLRNCPAFIIKDEVTLNES